MRIDLPTKRLKCFQLCGYQRSVCVCVCELKIRPVTTDVFLQCVGVTADLSQDRRHIITHSEQEKMVINSVRTHTHTHTHTPSKRPHQGPDTLLLFYFGV